MANRAKAANINNHSRQKFYLQNGIVMLPSKSEELKIKKLIKAQRTEQ